MEADRSPLDRESVLTQALALLDEVGHEKLTMRALAERLGTYPNVVYWHVGNREQVLAAAVDRALSGMDLPDPMGTPWQDWLATTARELRRVVHAHPSIAPLLSSRLLASLTALRPIEATLTCLDVAGFAGAGLAGAYNAYVGTVIGWVSLELATPSPASSDWQSRLETTVAELDPADYPTITAHREQLGDRIIGLRWHGGRDQPLDEGFEFMVGVLVRGLASASERA